MKQNLYLRYSHNDLKRNWDVNLALITILVLSAFLMATGSMVMERLVGGINQLFDKAKPPHFLQMHVGDYDMAALEEFAAQHPEIEDWLIEDMRSFDSSSLTWSRPSTGESGSLSKSLLDNLFVTQNEGFDYLLSESEDIVQPSEGEVYVPVAYETQFSLESGDVLGIRTDEGTYELQIAGFIKDAQMASSLSASTRFVVSEADFAQLTSAGGWSGEIIVEYRLSDDAQARELQNAYETGDTLPHNGQGITYGQILLINAVSDGLAAIALVFASLVLVAIALINLRFVIRGTIEDEVKEIGVMRAIGLPTRSIMGLYLGKYSLMTLAACIIGGILGIFATNWLTTSIAKNYSISSPTLATVMVPIVALVVVYVLVVGICYAILRSVGKVQVVGALVHGTTLTEKQVAKRTVKQARRAHRTDLGKGRFSLNSRLALLDLRSDLAQWILIPLVFLLASVLLILPMNLFSTFTSSKFMTYMGVTETDIRADVLFSDTVVQTRDSLVAALDNDDRISNIRTFANVLKDVQGEKGWEVLPVEVGDYSQGTVEFLRGGRPEPGQIALSVLNANRYHVDVGDTLTFRTDDGTTEITVAGIYQDVSSGGHTAKMQGEVSDDASGYVVYAETDGDPTALVEEYRPQFPGATIFPMDEYVHQTLSYVIDAFQSAAILSLIFALGVAALITGLFLRLQLTRERHRMGVMSTLGFSRADIIAQVRLKTLIMVGIGTVLGTLLTATLGESVVSSLISLTGLGLTNLTFIPNPLLVYVAYPLVLILVGYLASVLLTVGLRRGDSSNWLNK